ncbi:Lrp/AsnC family transcriptional regulator [uncultured Salinisphaera sp.]|uniref:Lrp/AsnC family transcriptional regulator n=1 Tax=uncultured Salinisphaera sp. TaxID=359372 RepID=UPI0032B2E81F|tara:strand:- start:3410 stop:3871 length:462 start_codon:yes stop_codon:yes gene_type:complete
MQLDKFDRKILAHLQRDGRLTSNELAALVSLSPSQCSRRRARLEKERFIQGYRAELSFDKLGYDMLAMIWVTLATHNRDNATHFAEFLAGLPEVLEAHALTGDMDYLLKVATTDLQALSRLVNDQLLAHETVNHVKTAIVLQTLKDYQGLPLT